MDVKEVVKEIEKILIKEEIPLFGFCKFPPESWFEEIWQKIFQHPIPQSLNYLKKEVWKNPKLYLPFAKTIISTAIPYNKVRTTSNSVNRDKRVWVSRYGFLEDYHKVLRGKLNKVKKYLTENGFKARVLVDSFPLFERSIAKLAGIGFIGKNGLLINKKFGSFLFLGEVVTDLDFEFEENKFFEKILCERCDKCVRNCPNGALMGDGRVNTKKCIPSYNVEWKGDLPVNAPRFSKNLFGCDICQEVCPYNYKAPLATESSFKIVKELLTPNIDYLFSLDEISLSELIKNTPLKRRGANGILENLRKIASESQTKSDETDVSS